MQLYRIVLSSPEQGFPVSLLMLPFQDAEAADVFGETVKRAFAQSSRAAPRLNLTIVRITVAPHNVGPRDADDD